MDTNICMRSTRSSCKQVENVTKLSINKNGALNDNNGNVENGIKNIDNRFITTRAMARGASQRVSQSSQQLKNQQIGDFNKGNVFDFEELDADMRIKLDKNHGDDLKLANALANVPSTSTIKASVKSIKTRKFQKNNKNINKIDDGDDDNDRLSLSSWGLPDLVLEKYMEAGIKKLFPWQAECLCSGKVLDRGNLVYSAPTSAGKTMVAELLMLKSVVETKSKALFIFPFVSVAREKCQYLQKMFQTAGVNVGGFYGGSSPAGGFSSIDIAVCTIEKANNLINRLLEDDGLNQLGCVVVDELHMVGDRHRGYLLELLVTKIRYVSSLPRISSISEGTTLPPPSIQIIGMSATLPNLNLLATWLDADLFTSDFRPVPLAEMLKVGADLFNQGGGNLRTLEPSSFRNDEDHVIHLCSETVFQDRCSVLVFCPTKNWCEKLADTIAREFYNIIIRSQNVESDQKVSEKDLSDVLELLRRSPSGLDPAIGKMIRCGVAYHHAGLTFEERDIIEGAFRTGSLKVLVATSTLSSGVNLPARRVIVRSPMFNGSCINALVYKQMIGRAGRKGVDIKGESILICKTSERSQGFDLLNSKLPPISSCLHFDPKMGLSSSMKRAILEIIVSKVASKMSEVELYARCTMLAASLKLEGKQGSDVKKRDISKCPDTITACINYLVENEFIQLVKDPKSGQDMYVASQLGQAVVSSGFSPEEGLKVFVELQRSSRCFVLENDLHLVYLVTPVYMLDQFNIDWYHYLCLWEGLNSDLKRVGEVVGVTDRFISKAVGGKFAANGDRSVERMLSIHKRFYMALALFDLINESPLTSSCTKFKVNKGSLQALQQSSSTFAGMITSFVSKLGWRSMEALLIHFQSRLSFGVHQELVDLVRIPVLTAKLARCFYNAGYVNVSTLALASVESIVKLLRCSNPFLSTKRLEGESEWELEERMRTSRCIFVSGGGQGLTEREAAEEIILEAKRMMADDLFKLGIKGVVPVMGGAKEGEMEDDAPALKKSKLKPTNDSQKSNASVRRNRTTKKSQTSKTRKSIGHKNRSQTIHKISINESESGLSGTSILAPPRCVLDQQKKDVNRDKQGSIKMTSANKFNPEVVANTKTSGPNTVMLPSDDHKKNLTEALHSNADEVRKNNDVDMNLPNPFIMDSPNDIDGVVLRCSTPKTTKKENKFFNPFVLLNSEKDIPVQNKNNPDNGLDVDMNANISEIVFNTEDSRFFQNDTEFLLMASEKDEVRTNGPPTYRNANKNTHLNNGTAQSKQDDLNVTVRKKDLKKLQDISNSITFNDEIIAGSQILEEFMQNTFDSSGRYLGSTSTTRFPTVSTPKGPESSRKIRNLEPADNSKNNSCVEILDVSKQYCQVVLCRPSSRNVSERKKRGRLDDLKIDKSPKISSNSGLYESKQYCSLSFDKQAPFSEELMSDFEVRPKNEKHISKEMLNKKDDKPPDLDISGYFWASSFEEDCVNVGNAFTKLKPIDNNLNDPIHNSKYDAVALNSKSIPFNNVNQESKNLKILTKTSSEALFESSELFNSFFDHSIDNTANPNTDCKSSDTKTTAINSMIPIKDLITPSAAAQLADSMVFDDINPTQKDNNPKKMEINHTEIDLCTDSPKRDMTSVIKKDGSLVTAINLCRRPGSAIKKFKSHNEPITPSRLDPDLEFVMKVFCDEDDGDRPKKWNKKIPKRINSSNTNVDCSVRSNRSALPKILQGPLSDKEMSKIKELHNGLKTVIASSSTSPHSNLQTSSKGPINNNINSKDHFLNNNVNPDGENNFDPDDIIPPTPPGSPERLSSKAFCSGTTTPRRLVVGVIRPSPRASQKSNLVNDLPDLSTIEDVSLDQSISIISSKKSITSRRLDMDSIGNKGKTTEVMLPKEDIIPSQRGPPSTLETFTICDVASNIKLFETFLQEWKTKSHFSICLACDRIANHIPQTMNWQIGAKFRKKDASPVGHKGEQIQVVNHELQFRVHDSDLMIVGLAVSWNGLDVYYISLLSSVEGSDLDRSMAAPDLDPALGVDKRLRGVKEVLEANNNGQIIAYDAKAQYKALSGSCGILPSSTVLDPKVACWLLDPGSREKTLHALVATSCPNLLYLLEDIESTNGISSLGMMISEVTSSRLRSCLESLLVRHIMDSIKDQMLKNERDGATMESKTNNNDDGRLWKAFVNTEMPVVTLLAKMELNGMGFDNEECESQKSLILNRISTLESNAYELAGHPFSLTSPDDVSRILYVELGLPPSGEVGVAPKVKSRSKVAKIPRPVTRFSSAKDILEKLTKLHPIAGVILEWRKLTMVVAKMVFPLQRARALEGEVLKMSRIHGVAETHTATGRVSMRDPNLQNIPKDFSVAEKKTLEKDAIDGLINESLNYFLMNDDEEDKRASDSPFCVSMRSAFVPFKDGILLAADYSQLELRIIAHMSGDQKLISLLNRGGDIFRAIAAQLKGLTDRDVTDDQRQHAKQICYGMIYGIGAKSLGQQLDVDEEAAAKFIESFKSTYSGIRNFLSDTVERCRRLGFVETMAGRRRYLPSINDERVHLKSHAERQSINTTIQGSAADIVKSAMLAVEERLVGEFEDCKYPHRHSRGKLKHPGSLSTPRGAYLILQLHDELIYEVNARDLHRVAQMVKSGMEEAATLSVVLPVKLKVGMSWGKMSDYSVS